MVKRVNLFRKVDLKRAVEAVKEGGMSVGRVEIHEGKIIIVSSQNEESLTTELDGWVKQNGAY